MKGKHGNGIKKSTASDNPHRTLPKKQNAANMRDRTTIKRLKMYRGGKAIRDRNGKIIGGELQMKNRTGDQEITSATGRVQPDRRWFGNTRVISQTELEKFRNEMTLKKNDPFSIVIHQRKLPLSLLHESANTMEKLTTMNLLQAESYKDVFDGKRQRKHIRTNVSTLAELLENTEKKQEEYELKGKDRNIEEEIEYKDEVKHNIFTRGQSKRIWGELYKVLDCSDVILHVVDVRNVEGTRCVSVEDFVKTKMAHKHMVFILNKCDLVPNWLTKYWVRELSKSYPTIAFHASVTSSFGKSTLISLLQQYSKLHTSSKQISVGLVGYPNVGKSSIINTLKKKKVCRVAPIPGETKVWQYITLMKSIFLIDCPGIVPSQNEDGSEIDTVLKGVVRAERVPDPMEIIPRLIERVKKDYIIKTYNIKSWTDEYHLTQQIAEKTGKLLPGGEPDYHTIAVQLIYDFQRGKLPWFVVPENAMINDNDDKELTENEIMTAAHVDKNEINRADIAKKFT